MRSLALLLTSGFWSSSAPLNPRSLGALLAEPSSLAISIRRAYTWYMDLHERLARIDGFQWDAGNVEKNWLAHHVSSAECEQLFFNQPLIVASDIGHSHVEERFFALGQSDAGRLLFHRLHAS